MGVMTWFARLLLVLSSVSPILIVYAAVLFGDSQKSESYLALGIAALFGVVCFGLLHVAKGTAPVNMAIRDPSERDGDALAFLVAYALPLATVKLKEAPGPWGLAAFAFVMTLLVWQQQIFHVNPLLGLRYHFFSATNDSNAKVLVLSTEKVLPAGDLPIVKLSDYLWLHCPKAGLREPPGLNAPLHG